MLGDILNQELKPQHPNNFCNLHNTMHRATLMQYTVKKGLEIFGETGEEALTQELLQVHKMNVFNPKSPHELTRVEKKSALEYLVFLKQKKFGRIKAHGCANGRKQCAFMSKEETSSPTVVTELFMITCIINAAENRGDVATVDVPGAFMHADMDDIVHVRVIGKMAELLVKIDPEKYGPYLILEHGKYMLYVQLNKVLYGTLQAALLFWCLLMTKLQVWGFKINLYDWCIVNRDINSKQCMVVWHVDDLKILHVSYDVVTSIITKPNKEFGKLAPLTVTRGKIHEYLGMTLDYSIMGKLWMITS